MAKRSHFLAIAVAVLISLAIGCSSNKPSVGSNRSDGQIASDVQNKINTDGTIQNKAISVTSNNGTVTLSGTVGNETEKMVASNDASSVEGVKQVINNLTVSPPVAAEAPAPEPPTTVARTRPARSTRSRPAARTYNQPENQPGNNQPAYPTGSNGLPVASTPPQPAAPVVRNVTIPAGTTLSVRTVDRLSSETSHENDSFHGTLTSEIYAGDAVAIPAGADVQGRVVEAHPSTHFSGQSSLVLQLTRISYDGHSYNVVTDESAHKGAARGKNTIEKTAGGAAVGAIIGAIAGGGKGAAIGAGAGAAAGTGANAVTKGQKVELPPETVLSFRLQNPITVTPGEPSNRRRIEPSSNP